jgi:predicted metalloprotease
MQLENEPMRRFTRVLAAGAIVLPLIFGGFAGARAQDDSTPPAGAGQYTSADYGYSLTWAPAWSPAEDIAEGGYDLLHLNDGSGDLYYEGEIAYTGDPTACVAALQGQLQTDATISNFTVSQASTPSPGGGVTARYTYSQASRSGSVDLTELLTCLTLRPGAAVLAITLIAPTSDYPRVSANAGPVMDSLVVPTDASQVDIEGLIASTEQDLTDFWTQDFNSQGLAYQPPTYVNFDGPISTGCGDQNEHYSGSFYCPADATVYLDIKELTQSVLPYGQFMVEVVVGHETGHHVEEQLKLTPCETVCADGYSGEQWELMADCFAGGWAKDAATRGQIAVGALENTIVGITAYFGDPPAVVQDSTDAHGPGALRTWWFLKGYFEGPSVCPSISQDPNAPGT